MLVKVEPGQTEPVILERRSIGGNDIAGDEVLLEQIIKPVIIEQKTQVRSTLKRIFDKNKYGKDS